jgi:hypothetical protein
MQEKKKRRKVMRMQDDGEGEGKWARKSAKM